MPAPDAADAELSPAERVLDNFFAQLRAAAVAPPWGISLADAAAAAIAPPARSHADEPGYYYNDLRGDLVHVQPPPDGGPVADAMAAAARAAIGDAPATSSAAASFLAVPGRGPTGPTGAPGPPGAPGPGAIRGASASAVAVDEAASMPIADFGLTAAEWGSAQWHFWGATLAPAPVHPALGGDPAPRTAPDPLAWATVEQLEAALARARAALSPPAPLPPPPVDGRAGRGVDLS